VTSKDEANHSRLGSLAFDIVRNSATLLCVVILGHNQLRNDLTAGQIGYLEVLPYLVNLAILLITVNALVLALPIQVAALEYGNNAMAGLGFWTLLLGLLFVVMAIAL